MELLHTFGVDPVLLTAQIVNFLVILYLLKRFLYKPIFKVLEERKNLIREGVEKSEAAGIVLEEAKKEKNEILKRARESAKNFIDDAKNQAAKIYEEAEISARAQTETMIEEAKKRIEEEGKVTQMRLVRYVSQLAVDFLKKSLSDMADPTLQKQLMQKAIKQMEKN